MPKSNPGHSINWREARTLATASSLLPSEHINPRLRVVTSVICVTAVKSIVYAVHASSVACNKHLLFETSLEVEE